MGALALVTLRSNYEQATRDDEGAAWAWEERSCTVPYADGLAAQVEAAFDAWAAFCDKQAAAAEAAAKHRASVDAAVDGLPTYQEDSDLALGELGAIAASAAAASEQNAARVEDLELAIAELGTIVATQ